MNAENAISVFLTLQNKIIKEVINDLEINLQFADENSKKVMNMSIIKLQLILDVQKKKGKT